MGGAVRLARVMRQRGTGKTGGPVPAARMAGEGMKGPRGIPEDSSTKTQVN